MEHTIQIFRNGHLLKTISLKEGTYSIGRDPSSDIVLDDKAVSKIHARLTIKGNSFIICDNNSSNGTFYQGGKISEHTFQDSFEIHIRPFTLKTECESDSDNIGHQEEQSSLIDRLILSNMRTSIALIICCLMILTLFIIYSPMKNRINSVAQEEHLNNGILLSRYLAEMNRPFLDSGEHEQIRTSPVTLEDGVTYAFVVDAHGRVIAPHDQQGNFFNWDELSQAFRNAKLRTGKGPDGETIIFSPIMNQGSVAGAGIIGFRTDLSSLQHGLGGLIAFLLMLLIVMSMGMSYLLVIIFLKPIRILTERAEMSIKEGRENINFSAPYKELDDLKNILGRLLLRKNYSDQNNPESRHVLENLRDQDRPDMRTSAGLKDVSQEPSMNKNMSDPNHPWCVISNEDYTVKQISDNFASILSIKNCKTGLHIIEAFDSELIQVVSQVMDDAENQAIEVELSGKKYQVQRVEDKQKNQSAIIFREESS